MLSLKPGCPNHRHPVMQSTLIPQVSVELCRERQASVKKNFFFARIAVTTTALAMFVLQGLPASADTALALPSASQVGAFITHINPQLPQALRRSYAVQVLSAAQEAQIDPCLLIAIVSVESHWHADAISPHGAIGLGQLKPQTAASLHADPYSPEENLRATSHYLRQLLDRFSGPSNKTVAIAAYNAGPTAVARNHNRAPNDSTRTYVSRVLRIWQQSRFILSQNQTSPIRDKHAIVVAVSNFLKKKIDDQQAQYWGIDVASSVAQENRLGFAP